MVTIQLQIFPLIGSMMHQQILVTAYPFYSGLEHSVAFNHVLVLQSALEEGTLSSGFADATWSTMRTWGHATGSDSSNSLIFVLIHEQLMDLFATFTASIKHLYHLATGRWGVLPQSQIPPRSINVLLLNWLTRPLPTLLTVQESNKSKMRLRTK